jgi:predicted amidohydrolase YtcJ
VAWVNHSEDVAGRLLPGMSADVTVLDQDLFAIPACDIGRYCDYAGLNAAAIHETRFG